MSEDGINPYALQTGSARIIPGKSGKETNNRGMLLSLFYRDYMRPCHATLGAVVLALFFIHSRSYYLGISPREHNAFYEGMTIIGVILITNIIVVVLRLHR